jgi:hypothetical protein
MNKIILIFILYIVFALAFCVREPEPYPDTKITEETANVLTIIFVGITIFGTISLYHAQKRRGR